LFGHIGPTNLRAHILESNFSGSSGHFSCITVHRYIQKQGIAKQLKVKRKEVGGLLAPYLYRAGPPHT